MCAAAMEEKRTFEKPPADFGRNEFIAAFGGVFEDSPWIAEAAWDSGITSADNEIARLHERMCGILQSASPEQQMALIRAHPELAAPSYRQKTVGRESAGEQKNAGLNEASEREAAALFELNQTYREKFGFPFIMAVAGKNKSDILAALKTRLDNEQAEEKETALREICQIALYRLQRL